VSAGGHQHVSSDTGLIWPGRSAGGIENPDRGVRYPFHAADPLVLEPHYSLWLTNFMIIFDLKGNERYRNAKEGVQKSLMTLRNTRLTAAR